MQHVDIDIETTKQKTINSSRILSNYNYLRTIFKGHVSHHIYGIGGLYSSTKGSGTKNPTRHASSIKSTFTHACVEAVAH